MKLANEQVAPLSKGLFPNESSLEALFNRLEALAMEPGFRRQREIALGRALRPYLVGREEFSVVPLPEEVALAKLYLYADFYPEDGQLSLVEQVRDLIEAHVPEEERAWLDPLRHSYMDLLEIMTHPEGDGDLVLRSLGDGREFRLSGMPFDRDVRRGHVLLTRLIRLPDRAVLAGVAVVLSAAAGRAILERAQDERREMEALSGAFELADWPEFCKRYGHALLWYLAQARVEAVIRADANIRYRTPAGEPFLYALALYEHHEFACLVEGLGRIEGLQIEDRSPHDGGTYTWVERTGDRKGVGGQVVARLTLSGAQLIVECESPTRLDRVKHSLAATFGFSLHFRAEATSSPVHPLPEVDLSQDELPAVTVVVTPEEERRLLGALLESAYLEWADLSSPALDGRTPRHAVGDPKAQADVARLIDQLEHDDPCRRRTGQPGYDFDRLRAHVGL